MASSGARSVFVRSGDHLLTDLPTVTATFNDLEIGASA
jgi:hypothetical protein